MAAAKLKARSAIGFLVTLGLPNTLNILHTVCNATPEPTVNALKDSTLYME